MEEALGKASAENKKLHKILSKAVTHEVLQETKDECAALKRENRALRAKVAILVCSFFCDACVCVCACCWMIQMVSQRNAHAFLLLLPSLPPSFPRPLS